MGESRTGLWAAFIIAAIVALVFVVLWFMRGGDLDGLQANLSSEQRFRSEEVGRLNDDLSGVRSDLDTATRRIRELDSQLSAEKSRADRATQEADRQALAASTNDDVVSDLRRRLTEAGQTIETQKTSLAELTEKLIATEASLADHQRSLAQLQDLQNEAALLRANLESAGREITTLRNEATRLLGVERTVQTEINRLIDEGTASRNELARLSAAEKSAQDEVIRLTNALNAAKAEMDRLLNGDSKSKGEIERLIAVEKTARAEIEKLTAANNAAGAEIARLTGVEKQLRAQIETFASKERDSQAEISRLAANEQSLRQEIARLQAAVKESQQEVTRLTANLAKAGDAPAPEALAALNKSLDEHKAAAAASREQALGLASRVEELEKQLGEATVTNDVVRELRGEVEGLRRDLASSRQALADKDGEIAKLGEALDQLHSENSGDQALSASRKFAIDKLQADYQAKESEVAGLNAGIAAQKIAIDKLQTDYAKKDGEVAGLNASIAAQKTAIDKLQADYAKKESEAAGLLSTVAAQKSTIGKQAADLNAMEAEAAKLAAAITTHETTIARQKGAIDDMQTVLDKQRNDLAKSKDEASRLREAFGSERPARPVGSIVNAMNHNKTIVIDLGSKQRVKPGVKFDVYRPYQDGNRYIGMIQVIRVEPEQSLAVATFRAEPVMVCPVTGFTVLEPGATYSPFARGADDKPVKLVEADELRIPTEAPGVGDILAHPFFDPEKPLSFAVEEGALDTRANRKKIVELLGGVPKAWNTRDAVDFAVVKDKASLKEGMWPNQPRVVTAEHLCRYYDELPRIQEETPPPCGDPAGNCLPIR